MRGAAVSRDRNQIAAYFPVPLVCPLCHEPVRLSGERFQCFGCARSFPMVSGFPDFVTGERFADETDAEQLAYEELSNRDLAGRYLVPLFRRLLARADAPPRILSLGCGAGTDVDVLCEAGFDCVGIDCGNRTTAWPRRVEPRRFLRANGQRLPFASETFDAIFCGCVFPHVGVVGDSFEVTPRYREDRLELAAEIARVLAPGGSALVSSPNRWFPFDIFHGRDAGSYRPIPYWPGDPFLLSLADYRRLFESAGLGGVRAEPVRGYWSFCRSRQSIKGRLLAIPIRTLFSLVSRPYLAFLRASPFNPWLVVRAEKSPRGDEQRSARL